MWTTLQSLAKIAHTLWTRSRQKKEPQKAMAFVARDDHQRVLGLHFRPATWPHQSCGCRVLCVVRSCFSSNSLQQGGLASSPPALHFPSSLPLWPSCGGRVWRSWSSVKTEVRVAASRVCVPRHSSPYRRGGSAPRMPPRANVKQSEQIRRKRCQLSSVLTRGCMECNSTRRKVEILSGACDWTV